MNEAEQFFLPRLEQITIQPGRQLQRFLRSQIVAQLNDVNAVLHAIEINLQIAQMGFNQFIEIVFRQLPFRDQHLHEPAVAEITLAALQQIAAELSEDGHVGGVVKTLRFPLQVGLFLCTDHAKIMVVDIAESLCIGQRMVDRIIPIAPGWTACDHRAVDDHLQGSIGVAHWMEARWNQTGGSIRQGVQPPGVQRDAEGRRMTVQLHDIGAETLEDIRLWFCQLLEHIVEPSAGERQAQMGAQTVVGDHIDAGGTHGAKVNGHFIRLLVIQCTENAFAMRHSWSFLFLYDRAGCKARGSATINQVHQSIKSRTAGSL